MIRARCARACTFGGRYWKPGEIYEGAATPPPHFAPLLPEPEPIPEPEPETEEVQLPEPEPAPPRKRTKK